MDDVGLPNSTGAGGCKARTLVRFLGLFFALGFVLVCIALFLLHPYKRMERLAGDMLTRYAPEGTTVNGITIGFPFNVILTNLTVPVQVQNQQRKLTVKKLSGKVSLLSLLRGTVDVGMNADFFGGILWLDIESEKVSFDALDNLSFVVFDARARDVDVAQLCGFFDAPIIVSGLCSADVEGELDERDLTSLKGRALVIAKEIDIPPIRLKGLVLPENPDAECTARFSAKNGKIFVEKLRLDGSAYDLSGKGTVRISDQPDQSPLDCSFSMVFMDPPMVVEQRLADAGVERIVEALAETGTEVFFKLGGTLQEPEVQLDPASSLGPILERFSR